jgi:Uma2 family endonuclease
MATAALPTGLTFTDYLAAEAAAEIKHEFVAGHAFAMAGATPEHAAIVAAVTVQLGSQLQGKPCRVYSSDLRIRMAAVDVVSYPDLSVVCGELFRDPQDRQSATNPSVIVEVLSDSTEAYDRGNKFAYYRTITSLQTYILVSQHQRQIELFVRNTDNSWTLTAFGAGDVAVIKAIGCTLSIDAVYADIALQ